MDYSLSNYKEVYMDGLTLGWGNMAGQPVLVKPSKGIYSTDLSAISSDAESFDLSSYSGMGYVIFFSTYPEADMYQNNEVLLVPPMIEGFNFPTGYLTSLGANKVVITDVLIENQMYELFADTYVSYTPTKNSIIPVLWKTEYYTNSLPLGITSDSAKDIYNVIKQEYPPVDLNSDEVDLRYTIISVRSNIDDSKIKYFVYNRNHHAFNGSVARDILMKPLLALFRDDFHSYGEFISDEFLLGNTDEIEHGIPGEVANEKEAKDFEMAMNPPVDIEGARKGNSLLEGAAFISMQ